MVEKISIGTDIEQIKRFENKTSETSQNFLDRIFTKSELDYCFDNKKNYAQHLCARFCAKEAVVKALSDFNISDVYYADIEILKNNDASPYVKIAKYPDLNVKISMSHTKDYACASAIVYS